MSLSSSSKIRRCVPRKYSYAFGSCSRSSIIFLTFSFNLQTSWLLCFYSAFLKILLTAYLNETYLLRLAVVDHEGLCHPSSNHSYLLCRVVRPVSSCASGLITSSCRLQFTSMLLAFWCRFKACFVKLRNVT